MLANLNIGAMICYLFHYLCSVQFIIVLVTANLVKHKEVIKNYGHLIYDLSPELEAFCPFLIKFQFKLIWRYVKIPDRGSQFYQAYSTYFTWLHDIQTFYLLLKLGTKILDPVLNRLGQLKYSCLLSFAMPKVDFYKMCQLHPDTFSAIHILKFLVKRNERYVWYYLSIYLAELFLFVRGDTCVLVRLGFIGRLVS